MNRNVIASLVDLTPILVSVFFGVLCTLVIMASPLELYQITPFSENSFGFFASFANGFYLVVLAGVGATILYLLLRRKSHRLVTLLIGFALTMAVFVLSLFYLSIIAAFFDVPYVDATILTLSVIATIVADYALFKTNSKFASVIILGIGGGLGAFLGLSIPTTSTVLILIFLAFYDVFAVYRGPVGKIANIGLDQLRGLSLSFKEVQIGLGDFTFYSMLSGHMLLNYGYVPCLASIIGIAIGCVFSFRMLEKKGMFPGLPLPIFLGLAASFIASLI